MDACGGEARAELRWSRHLGLANSCCLADLGNECEEPGIPPLHMRIGIQQGPVVIGNFRSAKRSDFTAIGPTVNLVSRIETGCEPVWSVIISKTGSTVGVHKLEGFTGQ